MYKNGWSQWKIVLSLQKRRSVESLPFRNYYSDGVVRSEKNLISALNNDGCDRNAFWAGFFWAGQVPNHELFRRLKPELLRLGKNNPIKGYEYAGVLAGIVLAGWRTVDSTTGERYVTNTEMRDVLVAADDQFRSSILWHIERFSEPQEGNESWAKQLSVFLNEVWPRQKSAKTPRMTARLCDVAFSDSAAFAERVDAILPLVTKIDQATRHELVRLEDETVSQHPEKTLALLSAILPEDASIWPYRIESALETIGVSEPSLLKDPRLIELKRRWNSR